MSIDKEIGPLIELSYNNESSAVISEYGGRLLGLFPRENIPSLLWINPRIKEMIKSRERAVGGDRYWISPEREFFYENPETWEGWFCPAGLDPAMYDILNNNTTSCTLSSPITIKSQITKEIYSGEITRQITLIKEPIKTGISYCGVEYLDDCVLYAPNLKINGWSLACVISGGPNNPGTVVIPTKTNPKPLSYFRTIPKERIRVQNNYVAFKIDVDNIYKLAIRPDDIDFSKRAKIGYILKLPNSDYYGFILKLSDEIPRSQADCFDIARDHPDGEIGVIQSYNSESPEKPNILRFGEIELQLNKFATIDNTSHGKATHQTISYIGAKVEILEIVEKYLGVNHPYLY
ncbi:MAG: DUF6786 family protein [Candidatus Thorarchaeota archaeon]